MHTRNKKQTEVHRWSLNTGGLSAQVLLLGSMVWPYLANRDVHGPVQQ